MILERLKPLLIDKLNVDESKITVDARLVDDLGADSLDMVDLVDAAQTEFDIEITDEDIEKIQTVGDIIECISRLSDDE